MFRALPDRFGRPRVEQELGGQEIRGEHRSGRLTVGRTLGGSPDGRGTPAHVRDPGMTRCSRTCGPTRRAGVSIARIGRRAGVAWPATPSSAHQRRGGSTACPSHGLTRPGPGIGQDQAAPPRHGKPRVPGPGDASRCPAPGTARDRPIRRPVRAGVPIGPLAPQNAARPQHRARSRSAARPASRPARNWPARNWPARNRPARNRPARNRPAPSRPALDGSALDGPALSSPAPSSPAPSGLIPRTVGGSR